MYTSIQKWGNSGAIRIPKAILEQLGLRENDHVEILAENDRIVLRPAKPKRLTLEKIFKGWDGEYTCGEADTGAPMGKEIL